MLKLDNSGREATLLTLAFYDLATNHECVISSDSRTIAPCRCRTTSLYVDGVLIASLMREVQTDDQLRDSCWSMVLGLIMQVRVRLETLTLPRMRVF